MSKVQATRNNTIDNQQAADRVEIIYYTDPLCCWSWGMEPQWRRLQFEFAGQISWTYCMGGLLPSWKDFNDPTHSVSRPIQMGPVWMHAAQLTGMTMNSRVWMEDAPASSYPACIAVKCAQLQSASAGERYLRMAREAIMLGGKNISKMNVLLALAERLSLGDDQFDLGKFQQDLINDTGLEAFRKDLNEVQAKGITRFPTFIMKGEAQRGIILTGYRPYNVLVEALKQVAPNIQKSQEAATSKDYSQHWESITNTEILAASVEM